MSELLSAQQILGIVDRKEETVEVPEWGGSVLVVEPVGDHRIELDRVFDDEKMSAVEKLARIVALTVCGPQRVPLFPYTDETIAALQQKSPRNMRVIRRAATRVCRVFSEEELRAALGKSAATPGDASSSGSLSPAGSPTPPSSAAGTPSTS